MMEALLKEATKCYLQKGFSRFGYAPVHDGPAPFKPKSFVVVAVFKDQSTISLCEELTLVGAHTTARRLNDHFKIPYIDPVFGRAKPQAQWQLFKTTDDPQTVSQMLDAGAEPFGVVYNQSKKINEIFYRKKSR